MDNSNQKPEVKSLCQSQSNGQGQATSYSASVKTSSQTDYGTYQQRYPQNTPVYSQQSSDPSKAAGPAECCQDGGGYINYGQQTYNPPPADSNNDRTGVTQQRRNRVKKPLTNYKTFAVFALFCCMPTGIVAIIYANKAQKEYQMGNISRAQGYNTLSRSCSTISVILGVLYIISAIIILLEFNYFFIYVYNTHD